MRAQVLGSVGRWLPAVGVMLAIVCAPARANPLSTTITLAVTSAGDGAQAAATLSDVSGTPSGTVTYDLYPNATCAAPATSSQTVTLDGSGSVPPSSPAHALPPGPHAYQASYSGDVGNPLAGGLGNAPATSACRSFTAPAPARTVAMTASATPPSADYGNTIVLGAAGLPPGATGTVSFTAADQTLCVATAASGGASCTTAVMPTGSYAVTATYSGDAANQPASAQTSFTITTPAPPDTAATTTTTTTADGTTTITTVPAFHFIAPPSILIARPVNAARYPRRQVIRASYRCQDGSGAPGLSACNGPVAPGKQIDTAKPGLHTFTVTGISRSGESTVRTLRYMVYVPSNRIAVAQPKLAADGTGTVRITVGSAGRVAAVETGWPNDRPAPPAARQRVLATASATVSNASGATVALALHPVATGRALLHSSATHWLRVRLVIAFLPAGGSRRLESRYGLLHIR